ncbi:uncharacterized protein LOC114165494 [Vigna unguiculata]|uniref:uncharacterized protein LOC114165494 n=1 Tax=Vigna unguiculata TaxID=3917 RepID=UPI00101711AE|nr:uncharacterized protein LOC114165494 [Vigna unguiculata]
MVDAMQPPVAAQPRTVIAPIRVPTVEDFLCHKPAEFTGKASPDEADAWLHKCEKIFRVMNCEDEQKLLFATYLLNEDAKYWSTGMQQQMETREDPVTWANFRTRFLEKYFPDTARQDMEAEFLALQQRDMSVQEYVNKFEHLTRYSSQNITEEWRCFKFERGLKHELKKVVTPLRERRFPVLVEQAKSVEHLQKGPGPIVSRHQKSVVEARQMKKSYSRPQTSQGPTCYQCGRPHLKRNCPHLAGGVGGSGDCHKCFICDKPGHFANNCPEKKSPSAKKPATLPVERARAAGRVFALTTIEATQSGIVW